MNDLAQASCVPCKGGIAPLTDAEIAPLLKQIADWKVVEVDGIQRLTRSFTFKDFRAALKFTNAVGELAELEQHHPDLHLGWGSENVGGRTGRQRRDHYASGRGAIIDAGEPCRLGSLVGNPIEDVNLAKRISGG